MKKAGLVKLIFLITFFVAFITVSIIGSMGLFKFDSIKSEDDPKEFSAEFTETENGYVFNLINGRSAYFTSLGAVGVRFNKGDVGAQDNPTYSNYEGYEEIDGGYKAWAIIKAEKGSEIKIIDYYKISEGEVEITRTMEVITVGEEEGFTTEFALLTQRNESISDSDWFNPAEFYVSGTHSFLSTNARTILSSTTGEAIISSNNTSALTLSKYKDGYVTTISDLSHTQQVTTYDDDTGMTNALFIDEDISTTGISYANYVDEETYEKQVKLAFCYPSHEQVWSEDGTIWRMLPVKKGISRTVSFKISIAEEKDFYSVVENAWRTAYSDMAITDKRYDQEAVYSVLLDSMQRSYSTTEWGGIPQYLTNAEHYLPESGFLYRNADIALLMYKAGVRQNNQTYINSAIEVLANQIRLDKIDTGIASYSKDNPVYYRVRYEGLATILDTYLYFRENNINLNNDYLNQAYLKQYIIGKAEAYKYETNAMGLIFYTKLWKHADQMGGDYSQTAIRLLDQVALENRFFGGYFGSVENQGDKYIGVAEDAMILFNAYLNAYDATNSTRYLELAKTCATWLETFNVLTPMNLNLKGDDGSKVYNSSFIGNQRFLAYGYNFNNTRHCILDCPTVSSAVDYERLYEITKDTHYLDFAQRLVYNSSIYVNMGDKVGLMDDPINSSGKGFINEFVGNTASSTGFVDGGIRGSAHTSNIAWCGYQLLYVYDKVDENRDSALSKLIFEDERAYNLAKYKLTSYDASKFDNFNNSPEKAIDGRKNTYWETNSSYMIIDLNEVCGIYEINISSLEKTNGVVKVSFSFDGVTYNNFTAQLDFDGKDSIHYTLAKQARYVKIETTSNEKITDIELMGVPEFYHTFSYDSTVLNGTGNYSDCLDVMNYETAWSIETNQTVVLTLDLGAEAKVLTQCAITFENAWAYEDVQKTLESYQIVTPHTYKIEVSDDNVTYKDYAEAIDKVASVYVDEVSLECRYVRLTITTGDTAVKVSDFKVMGVFKI